MLHIKNLSVNVGDKQILTNFSFNFEPNKIYAIMGPNGSGKSTLAYALMGHPSYNCQYKSLRFEIRKNNWEDIGDLSPDERARKGIFLSFQTPMALAGVRIYQLLQLALQENKDALEIRHKVGQYAKELRINEELLVRSLNDGASGGERKKMEVLQAAVLNKKFQIFDEVDTGVDIDSLKAIAFFLDKHKKNKTYVLITHYNRILRYLRPDKVLVIVKGRLVSTGDAKLAEKIEKEGYSSLINF